MNLSKISKSLLIALPMIALGACSSNSATDSQSAGQNGTAVNSQAGTANNTVQTSAIDGIDFADEKKLIEQYSSAILENTINFEFDKSTILPEFTLILDAHAKLLVDHPTKSVTVEGHADEKGTPEYNIALGERRAIAVSNYLQNMGVAEAQINVVSYGEEKPASFAHNEAAWSENRRAVLVY